jgi:hypothetical protein
MYDKNIAERQLISTVAEDWFRKFDTKKALGNIDFSVSAKNNSNYFLWAEAKKGTADKYEMFAQLILTVGKARTFDHFGQPSFLGAFDCEKIIFLPFDKVIDLFFLNDFNWQVTASTNTTHEFLLIKNKVDSILNENQYEFRYSDDKDALKEFIKSNFNTNGQIVKLQIDKNNFVSLYWKWRKEVLPYIDVLSWKAAAHSRIYDSDFFLADIMVDDKNTDDIEDDETTSNNISVYFEDEGYIIPAKNLQHSTFNSRIKITNINKYKDFWRKYKRPPIENNVQFIINRKDLLVEPNRREIEGSFFTPRIWVEKAQNYLLESFGDDWQDKFYIWDCAAGTGNLLDGLINKRHIWASTLDKSDINVLHERIEGGANLLPGNVFQFDFLNDDFSKLPQNLSNIINDENKRQKLIILINPPYKEATSAKTVTKTGNNAAGVVTNIRLKEDFKKIFGSASNELYALFMARIYKEIPGAKLALFCTPKFIEGANFEEFRKWFKASFKNGFVVPSNTFDNVQGKFPIAFTIWDLDQSNGLQNIRCSVFDNKGLPQGEKTFFSNLPPRLNVWLDHYRVLEDNMTKLGLMSNYPADVQNNKRVYIALVPGARGNPYIINEYNLKYICIFFSVRHSIKENWLNNRQQFLAPTNEKWESDTEFHNDCLAYTIFHEQNKVVGVGGLINHWIPFDEVEVGSKASFESNLLFQYINGNLKRPAKINLMNKPIIVPSEKLEFSSEANDVFNSGKELWKLYHRQKNINHNASLFEIKQYFQGFNGKGKLNIKSQNSEYSKLLDSLKINLDKLGNKINLKSLEYEFYRT